MRIVESGFMAESGFMVYGWIVKHRSWPHVPDKLATARTLGRTDATPRAWAEDLCCKNPWRKSYIRMDCVMRTGDTDSDPRDDAALVAAIQGGDAEAFAPLLDRHLGHMHAFIALKLQVPHLVDEIAHETFVFAYHHIGEFAAGTSFRAWLRAIAANKIRAEVERYCREQANQLSYAEHRLLELGGNKPDAQASREVEALHDCLNQVPENLRALLTLKYHDECSGDEIAQRLRRSLSWVHTTLFRLRQQLKACVEAKLAQEPS
ncbi:MAG: RNA polymerase sigma factor [Verrucomicrobia bacterium]|nr:RNA polymerase sigma factor [Verrucomicrobiota bacterium]